MRETTQSCEGAMKSLRSDACSAGENLLEDITGRRRTDPPTCSEEDFFLASCGMRPSRASSRQCHSVLFFSASACCFDGGSLVAGSRPISPWAWPSLVGLPCSAYLYSFVSKSTIVKGAFANNAAYPAGVGRSGAGRAGMAPVVLDGGELLCCEADPRATSPVLGGGDLGRADLGVVGAW